ncbi:MAG: ABC transporter substrate-binding protein, partial [Gammaproteobacteria bacterium]|nr:ABC transporter substrate-binding protein [Gammaproteobacteria bacterium]
MRPGRYLLLAVLCCLILAGCSENRHDGLRFGLAAMPVTLDPRYATDAASSRINRLVYDRLVDFDDSLNPVPALATWRRQSPTRYRFSLTKDVVFSDGEPLTMADVRATYASILEPKTASPHRMSLTNIRTMKVVDKHVLDFTLEKPDLLFPGRLSMGILPAALIAKAHPFNTRPVGSGAFRFVDWPDEGHLQLERKRDGLKIAFVAVKDPTVRVLKLVRGEIDM